MLFKHSFRVFFLLSFISAAVIIINWILIYPGLYSIYPLFVNMFTWHAHEMIYGFVTAVLSGFLLTAVALWTNTPPVKDRLLILLAILWIMGRIVITWSIFPPVITSVIDLSYIPFLILVFARPLFSTHNRKNYILLVFLCMLFGCNLLIHLAHHQLLDFAWENKAIYASVGVVLLFITLIAGRIIPMFTVNALNCSGVLLKNIPQPNTDIFALLTVIIFIGTLLVIDPTSHYTGWTALIVALVHSWRIRLWHTRYCFTNPLLWILHIGYLWMILGMILWFYSTVINEVLPISIALHLITIGCIGSLCLGMMARVALGHTGRSLEISKLVTIAFILLQLSVFSRLLGVLFTNYYILTISIAGLFWVISFTLYGIVYIPILSQPMVDKTSSFPIRYKNQ